MSRKLLKANLVQLVFLLAWHSSGACVLADDGLRVSPEDPYYFLDGEKHVFLVGASDRSALAIWENDKGFFWKDYLDDLASHRLNYVRQDVCSWGGLDAAVDYPGQFSHPAWPFCRVGPGKAVDGRPKFDLERLDQIWFDTRLKPFLREARQRGIYVELTLFEGFRRARAFDQSLYADANNVNRLELAPRMMTSDAALNNPRLLAIQHAFVDKVLAETAEFGNVIYEVSNETGGRLWVEHFIDYIHHHKDHPSRLVSAGEQSSAFDPTRGENDVVVKHRGGGGPYAGNADVRRHHDALLRFRAGKPVTHNEYFLYVNRSTDDVNFPRKMMWADFTAGGHSNFYDFSWWRGSGRTADDGRPSQPPPAEILDGGRQLVEFVEQNDVPFWLMAPHDELAGGSMTGEGDSETGRWDVMTFALPGHEYVCYVLGDGPATVSVRLPAGRFVARWYDPKSGTFVGENVPIAGGGGGTVTSPEFEEDIVLHIRNQDSDPT